MRVLGYDVSVPRALLVGLTVFLVAAVVAAGVFSTAAFGAYNPSWDGTTDLRSLADEEVSETVVAREVAAYNGTDPEETAAVVLSPTQPYQPADARQLRQFASNGGTLLIAGDFGRHTNPLLADMGVDTRLNGTTVRDERNYFRGPAFPTATNVSGNHSLTTGVDQLTLNYGTVLSPGPNATVLAQTSSFAYLDVNGNESLDDAETLRSYPVVASEPVGDGRVVVVSDPSIVVNAMLDQPDNRQLARNLFETHAVGLFDYSHVGGLPPLTTLVLVLRESPVVLAGTGIAGVVVLALWGRGRFDGAGTRLRHWLAREPRMARIDAESPTLDTAEIVTAVTRRHPDWDADRVERVAQEINRRRQKGTPDTQDGDNG